MDQLRRELGNVNRDTNSLAADVEKILKRLDNPKKSAEVKRDLEILKGKLEGMASGYEPDPEAADPNDPNVTGKNEGDLQREKDEEKKNAEEIQEARDKKAEDDKRNTAGSEPSSLLNNKTTFTGVHGSTEPPPHVGSTPPGVFPPPAQPPVANPFEPNKPEPTQPWNQTPNNPFDNK